MRPIEIHPFSALLGAGALGLVAVLASAQQSQFVATGPAGPDSIDDPKLTILGPIQVDGIPTPGQMVAVYESGASIPVSGHVAVGSFVVPSGKLLVITGVGSTGEANSTTKMTQVLFDGSVAVAGLLYKWQGGGSYAGGGPAVPEVPPGLVATEGTTITVVDASSDFGVAFGYLADA